jgi:hypothetical protein
MKVVKSMFNAGSTCRAERSGGLRRSGAGGTRGADATGGQGAERRRHEWCGIMKQK